VAGAYALMRSDDVVKLARVAGDFIKGLCVSKVFAQKSESSWSFGESDVKNSQ